ncbi:MAG: DUF3750 domain-containing protein [Rhizobiaceae bacterium]|nr:DUF3750 domain-containing protein [Rhizobiaceae bacterium]MCV0405545.1 DUF3750 domain-containing protein [Rhizobiaceae bacterium]
MIAVRFGALFIAVVFLLPALATMGWWSVKERPVSWSRADWSSSGLLPAPSTDAPAAVYVLAARTGGLKGAFSVHSWVVLKDEGAADYERYDKVGWGEPVRRNHRPADGRWYSNEPRIVCEAHGAEAAAMLPAMRAAIASYPWSRAGDYHIWPGPNSNSFVAHVTRSVPQLGACLPPNAAGRDFAPGLFAAGLSADGMNLHVTFGGLAGFAIGKAVGLELHFLGLVAGVDILHPALKIPAFGRVALY